MRVRSAAGWVFLAMGLVGAIRVVAQRSDAFVASRDHSAIRYTSGPTDTAATRLNRDLAAGKTQLTFDNKSGYLQSLLTALGLPVESQLLVFSQTSAQADLINPANPRAIYFNDTTAVGWVRGASTIEIAAHDPRQGTIFYTLDQQASLHPHLKRNDGCLQCHLTWDTLGVPGWTMISTFPMSDDPYAYASGVTVDDRTDLPDRWGGWYVTGKSVPPRHYGNLPVFRTKRELALPAPPPPVLQSVAGRFDVTGFPAPFSDVAASMVLSHQTHMTNLLTRLGWEGRVAEYEKTSTQKDTSARIDEAVRNFVDYLLFVDEAALPQKIAGSSGFAEKFSAQGPADHRGRSLRQLDLEHRLFRYPCSYMIYSPAFDALPAPILDAVFRRMWQILSGQDSTKPYARLTPADRTAIVEILRDTKTNLPPYFRSSAP